LALTLEEGTEVVKLARRAVEELVLKRSAKPAPEGPGLLSEKRGVFVTLNLMKSEEGEKLRGCIGFPYPVKPLGEATHEAAVAAASEDPRFSPVKKEELGNIVVEVSILTPPETISVASRMELPSKIRIGTDGLIVSTPYTSGLLLPQVASEYKMAPDEFLSHTCLKAGLPPDAWLIEGTEVKRFQAEIFGEETPGGPVVRHRD
jgi:uncharacterized protein (TIGR00296 family)